MPEPNAAARYRHRAEELRTIAQDFIDADAMLTLARLATQYETMADQIEHRDKAERDAGELR